MGVLGTIGTGALGALQTKEYGYKGMVIGGISGIVGEKIASHASNDFKDEDGDSTVGSSFVYGAVNGVAQSSMSTVQELLSYNNPHRVYATSSVNSTTTATAGVNFITNLMRRSYSQLINQLVLKQLLQSFLIMYKIII